MRAKQFTRKVNETFGDGDVANAVVAEVIKLIGEGHTEVSPDVITTKVSAALGRPFMLKDLVAANNSSPELQHYIDSINPSKIKFSTDILTVKNQDPAKDKAKAQSGVANMAARAASRPRLGESTEGVKYGVYKRGGSIGERKGLIKTFDTKEEAQEYAKRQRRHLSPGERKYYKLGYNVKPVKPGEQVDEGWNTGEDRVSLPDEPSTYWSGKGALQADYNRLYDELVPSQGKADTIEGEVLRASSKIVYRHFNDGDEFNQASFDQLEPYIGSVTSYDDLAHKAIEFALKANGNYTPNPNWDSLDVMDYGPVDDDYDDEEDDDYDDWSDDVDDDEEDLAEEYDEDDYEDEDQGFFVAIGSEDDGGFVGIVTKDGGKWREGQVSGKAPYNWGGSYMGYLTPDDVMQWIQKDYRNYDVEGPFSSEEEAREHAQMQYGLDEGRGDSKGLHKKVTVVKGRDAGKTGYVRQIKTDKLRNRVYLDLDLEDGGQAVVLKQDVRLVKEVDEGMEEFAKAQAAKRAAARKEKSQPKEGAGSTRKYEMMLRNGQVKKFVAKDDADAKRIAAGHGAKSVIKLRGGVSAGKVAEGWESGPEERSYRSRSSDPDDAYDAMRQEKADDEAERQQARRPQEKYYTLVGRGPNMEPNYEFPGEFDSLDAAVVARKELMANPKTPNPRDIGISKRTRYLDEGRETPLRDLEDYKAKKKTLQDIQMDPHTSKDPELSTEVIRRLAGLEKQRKDLK
jgi:hypothetical protein